MILIKTKGYQYVFNEDSNSLLKEKKWGFEFIPSTKKGREDSNSISLNYKVR